MDEAACIDAIWARWPRLDPVDADLLRFAAEAVERHPKSAEIQWLAGSLNELAFLCGLPHPLDPLACYRNAVAIDPTHARAWVSIASWLDVHADDLAGAEAAYREVLKLDPESDAYEGLARVLAEQGRRVEAIEVLESAPRGDEERRRRLREEIERGAWE